MGGDAKNDQRIHAYIKQLGYKGVAHWSESGTRNIDKLAGILKPGQIYLFHTTDADVKRLEYFIRLVHISDGSAGLSPLSPHASGSWQVMATERPAECRLSAACALPHTSYRSRADFHL